MGTHLSGLKHVLLGTFLGTALGVGVAGIAIHEKTNADTADWRDGPAGNTRASDAARWRTVQAHQAELLRDKHNAQDYADWLKRFDHLRGKPLAEQARGVDRIVDEAIIKDADILLYKKTDYWASPLEVLCLGKGDCEDIAFLKHDVLERLGAKTGEVAVLFVATNWGDERNHAVAAISTRRQGNDNGHPDTG